MSDGSMRSLGVLCTSLLALLAAAVPARAAVETLTLFQKTARAPLVVRVRALSDATRRPRMEVLEVYKGSYASGTLVVAPHFEDYASPTPWLHREAFRKGEESILFLAPYLDEFGRDEGPETFALLNADQGKLAIPSEGGNALTDALRRFTVILSMKQHDQQSEALRALLREKNPYLLEAALSECAKYRLAEESDIETMLGLLESRREDFRVGALALLSQILVDARAAGRGEVPGRSTIFERVAALARLDTDEAVRRKSVDVLEAFDDSAALSILDLIGSGDASQNVRYEAQVSAFRLREKLKVPR